MLRLPSISSRAFLLGLTAGAALVCLAPWAGAQSRNAPASPPPEPPTLGVLEWLQRMHAAARKRNYVGTFVVSGGGSNLSSARIWHACEGDLQIERIETLSGPQRSTFRRNDQVLTFLPESKVARSEKRENLGLFPGLNGTPDRAIAELYDARLLGKGRVAGFDADVVELAPRDALRFGYRIWSERRSGLVVALQTLDAQHHVVEQSAFSELQLDAPLKFHKLVQMMNSTAGYRVEKSELERTTAQAEGWALHAPVVGFRPVSCLRRAMGQPTAPERMVQWTFSDGLATVSLFLEAYDAQSQPQEAVLALGATYTMTRKLADKQGDWWLTAVGEVPPQTLEAFAKSLVRTR